MRLRRVWPWAALCLFTAPGFGQEKILTLDEALALARERAADVVLARGRVEEARARQTQAGRRLRENPEAEVQGGYRRADEDDFLDFEATVTQGLYSGRRRAARLAGTQAALDRAEAEVAEARRRLLRNVWTTFARVQAAGDRVKLLTRSRQAADELLAATERRYEAGEATALDLNRSRVAAATARAALGAAEAEGDAALAELKALLGLQPQETVEIRGNAPRPSMELEPLLAGLDQRPDLRALAAELREAEAEILLGQTQARPDVGVRGGIAREEGAEIVTAGLVVTLPVHGRGQESIAVGQARASALRQALATARGAADAEVRGRHAVLSRQLGAVRELETTALPALEDNESLALKSFEAGEIDLDELLLIRREILETRLTYLERLLDATLTRYELEAAAGALQ